MRSIPRIIDIAPGDIASFIEELSATVYREAKMFGGTIPYTVIREVSENFIHAHFQEVVISIFDDGNTIRFSDQGPGIIDKEKAQQPGFSSASQDMKQYIRGVGSGLPYVKEYLDGSHGTLVIEDNLNHGTVVTLSTTDESVLRDPSENQPPEPVATASRSDQINAVPPSAYPSQAFTYPYGMPVTGMNQPVEMPTRFTPVLSEREKIILSFLKDYHLLGVTELSDYTGFPVSSIHNMLKKLEEAGLIEKVGKKRQLTAIGLSVS